MSNQRKRPKPGLSQTVAGRAQAAARAAERERTRKQRIVVPIVVAVVGLVVIAGIVAVVMSMGGDDAKVPVNADARHLGCYSCHSTDGARSEGPTWKGLAGSQVALADGTVVTADSAYLRRAILDPQAQVVAGHPTPMPQVEVTEAEADRIVAYIESLPG
jgi:cytochrome c1